MNAVNIRRLILRRDNCWDDDPQESFLSCQSMVKNIGIGKRNKTDVSSDDICRLNQRK